MNCIYERHRSALRGLLVLTLATTLLLCGASQSVQAGERGPRGERGIQGERGPGDRGPGDRRPDTGLRPGDRGPRPGEFRDSRYRHDRYYPVRGHVITALPRGNRVVFYGRSRFYFHGGVWYRPSGPRFVVVAPPIGLFLPFLPPYYTTIWVRGVPYYYANDVYYAHRGDGYVVVDPPQNDVSEAPPPADQLFVYPRLGQSEQQQADDKYECHRWAVSQTGFDPTQPPGSPGVQNVDKRPDYQRAMSACLDGRGYTVK